MTGFEPATSCSQSRARYQAALHPVFLALRQNNIIFLVNARSSKIAAAESVKLKLIARLSGRFAIFVSASLIREQLKIETRASIVVLPFLTPHR